LEETCRKGARIRHCENARPPEAATAASGNEVASGQLEFQVGVNGKHNLRHSSFYHYFFTLSSCQTNSKKTGALGRLGGASAADTGKNLLQFAHFALEANGA
jgi:hypothetical protein